MDNELRERIGSGTKYTMLFVAIALYAFILFIDIIPIVGWIIAWFVDITAWIIFWMWFKVKGASLAKNKGKNIASFVVAFIPEIGGILTAFPIVIYLNIRDIQKEDAEYNAAIEQQNLEQRLAEQEAYEQMLYEEDVIAAQQQTELTMNEEDAERAARRDRAYAYAEADEAREKAQDAAKILPQDEVQALGKDALDLLSEKFDKSPSDKTLLMRADRIIQTGKYSEADLTNPVLAAAVKRIKNQRQAA